MKKVVKHMKVVLIKDIPQLGQVGESKDVKPGYARNFLLVKGLAVLPSDPKAQEIIVQKSKKQKEVAQETQKELAEIKKLEGKKIVFSVKVNKKGVPFKAIQAKDIAQKLKIEEKQVLTKPIKKIGEHQVVIKRGDTQAKILVVLEAEK